MLQNHLDNIAANLLPKDMVEKVAPVQVPGDGSCMFHVVCKALETADEKVKVKSDTIRADVSEELRKNAKLYTEQMWQHSMETAKSTSESLQQRCLFSCAYQHLHWKLLNKKRCRQSKPLRKPGRVRPS